MTPLEIRPLTGAGAEVLGVDVTAMTVGEWNQIEAAFASFGLLTFSDQLIDAGELSYFAEQWGPSTTGCPSIAHGWVSDRSHCARPTAASVILPRQPQVQHGLQVSSMTNAFDALSSSTQLALETLDATHQFGEEVAVHPLVIRHPVSGRKVMYLNPAFTTSIVGFADSEATALLNELFAHSLLDEFVCEVPLEPGSVVLVDHRSFLHFADPATDHERTTLLIEGTVLAPAVLPEKADPSFTQRAGATLAGGILTAAMTGIADVIEPEKRTQDIEIVSDAPEREPLSDSLDFGDLPPLD